ncbi:hypothetical protein IGI04_021112, partial [Brassica rapa subsp. trilocularis]
DQNTAYFFRIFQARCSYNSIRSFVLTSGIIITDPQLMSLHAITHFRNLLGPDVVHVPAIFSPPSCVQKSSFFSSGLSQQEVDTIKASTGMPNGLLPVRYLGGSIEGHHAARVSWETVTKSREGGGLGIKDLGTWNRACCLKLIWMLFFQGGSVWVAWFRSEVLHGSLSNYWTVNTSTTNSWLANKLIKMRGEVYTWIQLRVGNGVNCRFWTDNWSALGSLQGYFAAGSASRQGIPLTATLSDLNRNGSWTLPRPRSEEMVQAQIALTMVTLGEEEDSYEWVVTGTHTVKLFKRLILLCWKGVIYYLWRERNQRYHNHRFQTSYSLTKSLDRLIKDKILSFRRSSPTTSSSLMQMWVATELIP